MGRSRDNLSTCLTVREVSDEYRVPLKTVKDAIVQQKLKATKVGRSYSIRRTAAAAWFKRLEGKRA